MEVTIRDIRNQPFIWIGLPESAALETSEQRSVYMALCELGRTGYVNASWATVAAKSKVSVSTVSRVLPRLLELGVIVRASEDEAAQHRQQQGYHPQSVLYKLVSLNSGDEPTTLYERAIRAAENAGPEAHRRIRAISYVFLNEWNKQTGQRQPVSSFIRLLQSIPNGIDKAAVLAEAMEVTLAEQRDNPLAYLVAVVKRRVADLSGVPEIHSPRPAEPPNFGAQSAAEFSDE